MVEPYILLYNKLLFIAGTGIADVKPAQLFQIIIPIFEEQEITFSTTSSGSIPVTTPGDNLQIRYHAFGDFGSHP